MRMWMVPTIILCRKHLLGEHLETHMFIGSLREGKKIDGFLTNNLFEPLSLISRHEELKNEMIKRGYNHKSEIDENDYIYVEMLTEEQKKYKVDILTALKDLLTRCPKCRKRFEELTKFESF